MDQRAAYLLQILETIGSPLMSAITSASHGDIQNDAQSMAALLAKTVEASIELGNIMEINPAEAQDDTLRVALAGLAGPLVAGQFQKRGRVPESVDIKKITSALQAVLTFSDNFTPTPETVERLKNLEASGQKVDAYQTHIQYMQAFIPVTEAIAAFPFGQPEAKLVMDVSERLVKKSVELREILLPDLSDEAAQKGAELGLLRGLTTLYSACHRAETEKVMQRDAEDQSEPLSIEPVWAAFELRMAMLEALAGKIIPGANKNADRAKSGDSDGPSLAAPPAAPPPQPPPPAVSEPPPMTQAPPAQPPAAEQPPVQQEARAAQPPPTAPPAQAGQGANPMSMFAKPKAEGEPPPVPPQAAPPAPPAEQAPPAQPPAAEQQDGDPSQDGEQNGNGGSPMSFFKKGDE